MRGVFPGAQFVRDYALPSPATSRPSPGFRRADASDPRERRQGVDDRERFDDTTKCILCAACTTSCPSFWADENFVGSAAIVNAQGFIFDSRDDAADERLQILNDRGRRVALPH